jgi:hypothetical protein
MKKIILAAFILIGAISANAQKGNDSKINFNVGAEIGFANGNLGITHSLGLGATAQIEYEVNEKTRAIATSGIINYSGRSIDGATKFSGLTAIPVLVGAKYYLSDNFFGTAQIGLSLFSGVSPFTYSPGLGFMINEKIEALVKYTGYSNLGGAFGVRVAYNL